MGSCTLCNTAMKAAVVLPFILSTSVLFPFIQSQTCANLTRKAILSFSQNRMIGLGSGSVFHEADTGSASTDADPHHLYNYNVIFAITVLNKPISFQLCPKTCYLRLHQRVWAKVDYSSSKPNKIYHTTTLDLEVVH